MKRRRWEQVREKVEAAAPHLETIYRTRFANGDRERFFLLWGEIADVLGLPVCEMAVDVELRQHLLQRRRKWWEPSCQDDLEYLIAVESRGRRPPATEMRTVGDVIDYLLE
jgi:hypothetical protein